MSVRDREREREKEREGKKSRDKVRIQRLSENYTCMYMMLNIKRHMNLLIRHIIY